MPSKWHEPLTAAESARVLKACQAVHEHFGSYGRTASALVEATGQFISDETVRNYLSEGKVPVHIAVTLQELVPGVLLTDLVPWLVPFCGGIKK